MSEEREHDEDHSADDAQADEHEHASHSFTAPSKILDFWFHEKARPFWFSATDDFDDVITKNYLELFEQVKLNLHHAWRESAHGCLALVICLDQFPRNMFRGTERAFNSDGEAMAISQRMIAKRWDKELPHDEQRQFAYMPYMHSESLAVQEKSVALYRELALEQPLHYAQLHYDIIQRFGRFPHRNEVLGRSSTSEEIAFLKEVGTLF